jgi:hypothetical protein
MAPEDVLDLPAYEPRQRELPDSVAVDWRETKQRQRIEALFHGLIMSRVHEGQLELPHRLPSLGRLRVDVHWKMQGPWYPIIGMMGGFAYRLERNGASLQQVAESWSRGSDGSGMKHPVTEGEVRAVGRGVV